MMSGRVCLCVVVLCMLVAVVNCGSKKKRDYYEVLGVPKDATQKLIKKAFHRLAKETHPDKHPEKAEQYIEVSEAYEVLSDEEKREIYDKWGHRGLDPNYGGGDAPGGGMGGFHSSGPGGSGGRTGESFFTFPFGGAGGFGKKKRASGRPFGGSAGRNAGGGGSGWESFFGGFGGDWGFGTASSGGGRGAGPGPGGRGGGHSSFGSSTGRSGSSRASQQAKHRTNQQQQSSKSCETLKECRDGLCTYRRVCT